MLQHTAVPSIHLRPPKVRPLCLPLKALLRGSYAQHQFVTETPVSEQGLFSDALWMLGWRDPLRKLK